MNSLLLVACWLCYQASVAASEVSKDGMCTITRLVRVRDQFPYDVWPCEEHFPSFSCDRIRSGETPIEDVYIPREEKTCCPGSHMNEDGQCQSPCPEGLYGQGCMLPCTCLHASGPCNPVDGTCTCEAGWTGRDCDRRCPPGSFGPNCVNQTSSCLNGGTNDPVTGECLCPVTFQGEHCELACTERSCRVNCQKCWKPATFVCNHVITVCLCDDDWRGYYCTEPCEPGFKGTHCEEAACSGNGIYNPATQTCKCNDGYHGDSCQDQCQEGLYGPSCRLSCDCENCDHVTGACTVCPTGFTGDRCTSHCTGGTWGPSCNQTCECGFGEDCDALSGACIKLHKPKSSSKISDRPTNIQVTGGIAAAGGIILVVAVAIILFITVKFLTRKRYPRTEAEAFPSLSVKPDGTHERSPDDYTKEDTVYQEIDDYPLRYIKPALPSAPPGTPLDPFKYGKLDVECDPDYLVPDVK